MEDKEIINIKNEISECDENIEICEKLLSLEKSEFCDAYKEFPTYPVGLVGAEKAFGLLQGKWKHAILMRLLKHPSLRYSQLKKELKDDGITDYMLSASLNELVEDKLITKKVYAEIPVRVEYSITDKTIDLWYIVLQFSHWYYQYRKSELEEKLNTSR